MNRATRLAAVYARISTDKQNPLSPADQGRKCREYAERNGIAVLDAPPDQTGAGGNLRFGWAHGATSRYVGGALAFL